MSHEKLDYLSSLPEPERQRCRDKLCVDGVIFDDPYDVNKACWSSDVKLLPPTSMAHVVIYMVSSPSQFTAGTVQAYKSLEAYNYFESGVVREYKVWKPQGAAVCFVRAKVIPSQRATTEPHDAWVCLTNAFEHSASSVPCLGEKDLPLHHTSDRATFGRDVLITPSLLHVLVEDR